MNTTEITEPEFGTPEWCAERERPTGCNAALLLYIAAGTSIRDMLKNIHRLCLRNDRWQVEQEIEIFLTR